MNLRIFAAFLIAAAISGCSEGPRRAGNVDASLARESLKSALESWKKGEPPSRLKAASPSIVVQDLDWEGGASLADYQIDGEGKDDTANLRVPVLLTIKDARGGEVKKSVTYVVSTSPAITVFREIF